MRPLMVETSGNAGQLQTYKNLEIMTNEVKLTAEELEMIQKKRDQENGLKRMRFEASKAKAEKLAAQYKAAKTVKKKATEEYFEALNKAEPGSWFLDPQKTVEESFSYTNMEGQTEKIIIKLSSNNIAHARYGNVYVKVLKHITYSASSFYGTNQGYKMYIHGIGYDQENRPLKSAKTVIKKVNAYFANIAAEKARKEKNQTAHAIFTHLMVDRYPTATVTGYTDNVRISGPGQRYQSREENRTKIVFPNGFGVIFRVYSDGSCGRVSNIIPKMSDGEILEVFENIKGISQISK